MTTGTIWVVMSSTQLLRCLEQPPAARRAPSTTTGFAGLDDLLGGLRPGQLWVLTGSPGQGCSTLLTQWAGHIATTISWRTWLAAPREDPRVLAARLLASQARVPIHALLRAAADSQPVGRAAPERGLDVDQQHRLTSARERLLDADLRATAGTAARSPGLDVVSAGEGAASGRPFGCFLDDVDLLPRTDAEHLAALAARGALVVAVLPRHLIRPSPETDSDLAASWTRHADVVIEVRTRGHVPDTPEVRAGEADLVVLRHRHGPTATTTVSFQPHYARFADPPADTAPRRPPGAP